MLGSFDQIRVPRQLKVVRNRHQGKDMNSEGETGDTEIKQNAECLLIKESRTFIFISNVNR